MINTASRTRIAAAASLLLAASGVAALIVWGSEPEWSELGVWALVSLPAALIVGLRNPGTRGAAMAVVKCGIALLVLGSVVALLQPGGGPAREHAYRAQATNSLKQVALALQNYKSSTGRLPPAVIRDARGKPLYSWRVAILPYMEQNELYNKFHLDEPWDSPHNRALLSERPAAFGSSALGADPTHAFIQAIVGPGSAFESPEGEPALTPDGSTNFADDSSQTILLVEARTSVPWSAPIDVAYARGTPIPLGGTGFYRPRPLFSRRPPPEGFMAALMDGSVRFLKYPIPEAAMHALITRNGREPIPPEVLP